MGWAYGGPDDWGRPIGYGVIAECDHPRCCEAIDRGLGYVCGPAHGNDNEWGCGHYFCSAHIHDHNCDNPLKEDDESPCPDGQHKWVGSQDYTTGEWNGWCDVCRVEHNEEREGKTYGPESGPAMASG